MYARLPEIADVLVNEGVFLGLSEDHDIAVTKRFDGVLAAARQPSAVRALLGQLFPAARPLGSAARAHGEWQRERRERRVSRGEVFRIYLYAALGGEQLPSATLEGLAQLTADPRRLAEVLAAIPDLQLLDALSRMDDYSADFNGEYAAETAGVLLDLYDRLNDEAAILSGVPSGSMVLRWAIGAVIRAVGNQSARAAAATALHDSRADLTSRLLTLAWFGTAPENEDEGHHSDPDHDFIPETLTATMRSALTDAVIAANPADLIRERMFGELIDWILDADPERARKAIRAKADDDAFMTELLHRFNARTSRRATAEVAVRSWHVFNWEQIAALLGEEYLRVRVETLRPDLPNELLASID